MIVSHHHRFIFLAVPRTGSQSVRAALRPLLGAEDWEQVALGIQKRLPVPTLAAIDHGHVTAREAEAHLPETMWRDYLKFAVIRDPWDRFLSAAWFTRGRRGIFRERPEVCMELLLRSPALLNGLHFRPQHTFLVREDGSIGVDFVLRFERLAEDFARVCEMIGLGRPELPRLNASARKGDPFADDRGLRAAVKHFYACDHELFRDLPSPPRRAAPRSGDQPSEDRARP